MSTPASPLPSTTTRPGAAGTSPDAVALAPTIPSLAKFVSHYERYNGPIAKRGVNQTTHTAEVRFPQRSALAVVKAFSVSDKAWLNEAVGWALAKLLGLAVPPQAMLLVAGPDDLATLRDPELVTAHRELAGQGAIVFWCTSRLVTKHPQHVWNMNWEVAVLRGESGRRLAAFDGWIGNCDRHADNAPFWVAGSSVAPIDHERLAFAQDWTKGAIVHCDRLKMYQTHLLARFEAGQKSGSIKAKDAKLIGSSLELHSKEHGDKLIEIEAALGALVAANVGNDAWTTLRCFLAERATDEFISERLGML